MAIGFIPRDQDDEENDAIEDEQHTLKEMWDARQLAEALEADRMLKDSHEILLEQVRTYAGQLESFDPDSHNAAQEIGNVVLTLSYADTAQERLEALTIEARRLMLAVAEAKRQRESTKLPTKLERLAPYARDIFRALVGVIAGGLIGLLVGLLVEGG